MKFAKKNPTSLLNIGMFVTELDRSWLGTPFMLEGLLIKDEEQIRIIADLCEFAYVGRTVSVGNYFIAPPKESVTIKRDGIINQITDAKSGQQVSKSISEAKNLGSPNAKFSLVEILKKLQTSNQNTYQSQAKSQNTEAVFNVKYVNVKQTGYTTEIESSENHNLATQIKTDFSNFIYSLTRWGSKRKELASTIDKVALKADLAKKHASHDTYKVTIFDEVTLVEDEISKIYPVYEKSQIATRKMFEDLALNHEIDLTSIHEALDGMVESVERNADALMWLAKLKQSDDYSYNHAMNVSIMLMALANFMSLPKKQVKDLGLAGLPQDIGKSKIPRELLHKQDKINAEEFIILEKHVEHSLALLKTTENISELVYQTIAEHHERIDGSGYPNKLTGNQISLTSQMAGLIDTYCAITADKVYAKGVYNQIALEKIHALRNVKFNHLLVDQLVQFLGMYPVSSLVELNTNEVGVVIQQNSVRRLQPHVMILLNSDKIRIEHPVIINLIYSPTTPSGDPYKILRGLPLGSYGLSSNNYYA